MPQAGVSVPRGQVHRDEARSDRTADQIRTDGSAEQIFDDSPYAGPRPVRAAGPDDDRALASRAAAAGRRAPRDRQRAPRVAGTRRRDPCRRARATRAPWTAPAPVRRDRLRAPARPASGAPCVRRARASAAGTRRGRPGRPPAPPDRVGQRSASAANRAGAGVPGRRTVTIQGRGSRALQRRIRAPPAGAASPRTGRVPAGSGGDVGRAARLRARPGRCDELACSGARASCVVRRRPRVVRRSPR